MWPVLLDMTKEESMQSLRNLELEAYSHLVSALRAQGPLNSDKRKLLKDTGLALNIPQDRHKAEVRRAINDEKLNTIAYHVTGVTEILDDWAQEGRRTIPLIPRMAPQTVYSAIADEVAEGAHQNNKQLPPPACTERKRTTSTSIFHHQQQQQQQVMQQQAMQQQQAMHQQQAMQQQQVLMPESPVKNLVPFRMPELPTKNNNSEEIISSNKKRKLPFDNSNNGSSNSISSSGSGGGGGGSIMSHQHFLGGPSKMSRTQQLYRQRTKNYVKELGGGSSNNKMKSPMAKPPVPVVPVTSLPQASINGPAKTTTTSSALAAAVPLSSIEETIEQIQHEINSFVPQKVSLAPSAAEPTQSASTAVFSSSTSDSLTTSAALPSSPSVVKSVLPVRTLSGASFKQITTTVTSSTSSSSPVPGPSINTAIGGDVMQSQPQQKTLKICHPTRKAVKPIPLGQKLIVVSNAQTLQTTSGNSILQKTLSSVPLVKNISVKNLEKFKIVTTGSTQLTSAAAAVAGHHHHHHNLNSLKHKVVTLKTNPTTKKVIPLSQLLGTKGGIKVLPYGGKIVGKTITTTASQPLYIVNTMGASGQQQHTIISGGGGGGATSHNEPSGVAPSAAIPPTNIVIEKTMTTTTAAGPSSSSSSISYSPNKENASVVSAPPPSASSAGAASKSSVLGDILKASGVTTDDFEAQIEEFRMPNNNHMCHAKTTTSTMEVGTSEDEQEDEESGVKTEIVTTSGDISRRQFNDSNAAATIVDSGGIDSERDDRCESGDAKQAVVKKETVVESQQELKVELPDDDVTCSGDDHAKLISDDLLLCNDLKIEPEEDSKRDVVLHTQNADLSSSSATNNDANDDDDESLK